MIRLITSYYKDDAKRMAEIDFCLRKNIENGLIDEVILFSEWPCEVDSKKIQEVITDHRPTFNDLFNVANLYIKKSGGLEDISIICNSDIYFDETLKAVKDIQNNQCFALTRWDLNQDHKAIHYTDGFGSQDAWIFKGEIKNINALFMPGFLGCDNRLAYEVTKAGYSVRNPSINLKAIHFHLSNVRHYGVTPIRSPYLLISPEEL